MTVASQQNTSAGTVVWVRFQETGNKDTENFMHDAGESIYQFQVFPQIIFMKHQVEFLKIC
jgi:hypothetical protein